MAPGRGECIWDGYPLTAEIREDEIRADEALCTLRSEHEIEMR